MTESQTMTWKCLRCDYTEEGRSEEGEDTKCPNCDQYTMVTIEDYKEVKAKDGPLLK